MAESDSNGTVGSASLHRSRVVRGELVGNLLRKTSGYVGSDLPMAKPVEFVDFAQIVIDVSSVVERVLVL